YRTKTANQQVRVDLISPTATNLLSIDSADVLRNLFITDPDPKTGTTTNGTVNVPITASLGDLKAFAGKTVRLRIAATNNQGKLIVGVDNVKVTATFSDSASPTISGLALRNPGPLTNGLPTTTDPTFVGRVVEDGSPNNLAYIEFDPNN